MISASDREIAAVATGSGTDRISRAAVVDSLREATRTLDQAMAASVQSAALSQLQPADVHGNVSREEVARVWLTNVLPALERLPIRDASGDLATRRLTEKLHKLLHVRLSQMMLEELPAAQDALGLAIDPAGGGELPRELVQPFVASLTAAALRATVTELGDVLLALPGLESLIRPPEGYLSPQPNHPPNEHRMDASAASSPTSAPASPAGRSVSQAEAVGAAEGLVRRMLEGALHGHHAAVALAEADGEVGASAEGGGGGAWGAAASPMSGKAILRLRAAEAAAERASEDQAKLATQHEALAEEHREVAHERDALLVANRQLDAELNSLRVLVDSTNERSSSLTDELRKAYEGREAAEADLTSLRASVQKQVAAAVEASQEAARRAFDVDVRHDRLASDREMSALRAACEAERAASEEARHRCARLEAEKKALERERAAMLAERAASNTRSAALAAQVEHQEATSPRDATPPREFEPDEHGWAPRYVTREEVRL